MALPFELRQRFCVQATLATGDASKTLVDVGAGVTIVVTSLNVMGMVAAAQVLYVGDTSGTVKVASYPASHPAVGVSRQIELKEGLKLTEGEDLIIKPAAAGPSVHVVAEGYLLKSNVNLGA